MSNKTCTVQDIHDGLLNEHVSFICMFTIIGAFGMLGNAITIVFFSKTAHNTSSTFLIMSLAWVDMLVCVTSFNNVAEIVINVHYTGQILCKSMHFLSEWSVLTSIIILCTISIDRYYKICRLFAKQLSLRRARIVIATEIVLCAVVSSKAFWTCSVQKVPFTLQEGNYSVHGHMCIEYESSPYKSFNLAIQSVDALVILTVCITIIITYACIVRSLARHNSNFNSIVNSSNNKESVNRGVNIFSISTRMQGINSTILAHGFGRPGSMVKGIGSSISAPEHSPELKEEIELHTLQFENDDHKISLPRESIEADQAALSTIASTAHDCDNLNTTTRPMKCSCSDGTVKPAGAGCQYQKHARNSRFTSTRHGTNNIVLSQTNRRRKNSEKNLTIMMLGVSAGFLICFFTYMTQHFVDTFSDSHVKDHLKIGHLITMQMPYVNSVINPILYYSINNRYRSFVNKLFTSCTVIRNN